MNTMQTVRGSAANRNKTTAKKKSGGWVFLVVALLSAYYLYPWKTAPDINPDIKVMFSPNGGIKQEIVDIIDKADSTVDIAMYSFTKREISWALVRAKERGIKIRVLLDRTQASNRNSKHNFLKNKGIDVRTMGTTMHHKFAVIDDKILITGSYNWTANAEARNVENILFIRNSPNLTSQYKEQFEELWERNQ